MTHYSIINIFLLSLILITLYLIQKRLAKSFNKDIKNTYISAFDDYVRITELLTEFSKTKGVTRTSLIRITVNENADEKQQKYFLKTLFSKGYNETKVSALTYIDVDDFYNEFWKKVRTNDYVYIKVSDLPDCKLKEYCTLVETKEFIVFCLLKDKTKIIYGATIGEHIGSLDENKNKIIKLRQELTNMTKFYK